MNRHELILLISVTAVLGPSAACKKASENPPPPSPPPAPALRGTSTITSGGGGTHTVNAVVPDVYSCTQKDLETRMNTNLVVPPGNKLVPEFVDIFKYGTEGEQLVEYAVGCAIATGVEYDAGGTTHPYPPAGVATGLLKTTQGWTQPSGLSTQQSAREDLHTCIASRLNPTGQKVDIWLEGTNVSGKESACDAPITLPDGGVIPPNGPCVPEALWLTDITSDRLTIHVWPSDEVLASCTQLPLDTVMKRRVCGSAPGACNLESHKTLSTDCIPDPKDAHFMACKLPGATSERSAITTRLSCSAFCSLYPGCNLPTICTGGAIKPCPTPTFKTVPCIP